MELQWWKLTGFRIPQTGAVQVVASLSSSRSESLKSFYLVDVIQVGSLIGPVVVTLLHPALDERRQHHDNHAAILPNHLQAKHIHINEHRSRRKMPCMPHDRGNMSLFEGSFLWQSNGQNVLHILIRLVDMQFLKKIFITSLCWIFDSDWSIMAFYGLLFLYNRLLLWITDRC